MKKILVKVGEKPIAIDIENTLEALQKAVGGYIETSWVNDETVIICDEEGRIKNKPKNDFGGYDFVGDLLIVGIDGENFGDVSHSLIERLCV